MGKIGWFEIKPLQRSQFSKMAVTAVLNSLQLITSMYSLPYVAISTTVVFRNISTLLCAIVEMLIFKERFSFRAKVSLVTIFLGSVFYAMRDLSFDARGYAWLMTNTIVYTTSNIYTKKQVVKMDQTGTGIALVTTLLTLPFFFCYAIAWGEIPQGIYDMFALRGLVLSVFLFLGLMGSLIAMSCKYLIAILLWYFPCAASALSFHTTRSV